MSQDSGAAGCVFISYVREDAERVNRLQRLLEAEGITVWRDTFDLWPGQDWRIEIRRAIESGLAFIACFSEYTESRDTSYQNEELILAIEMMRRRPPGKVWLFPVRFADCQLPPFDLGASRTLDSLQRVDLFNGTAWEPAAARLAAAVHKVQDRSEARTAPTGQEQGPSDELPLAGSPHGLLPMLSWVRAADVDALAFGVHRARSIAPADSLLPPYVERDHDGKLRERLKSVSEAGGFVLLVGDSTAGKTRTAFEAMRSVLTDHRVLAPPRDANIGALSHLIGGDRVRSLLWLDDLEDFLRPQGLDPLALATMIQSRVVILATIRSEQYESYLRSPFGRAVLNVVEPIEISRLWSTLELDRLAEQQDERLLDARAHHGPFGVAEYLAAGPPLLLEWHQAMRVGGHPRGAALVRAAVDLARIGFRRPLPQMLLRRVHKYYLTQAGGEALRPESFDAALDWATQVRYGATSLLIPTEVRDEWLPFDYLVDAEDRGDDSKQVPPATWHALLDHDLEDVDLFAVGIAALDAGRKDTAESAWRSLAEDGDPWAMYNLGCLLAETEEITPLVEWWGGGSAVMMAASERADEAELWWRRAAKMGHVESMHNLGLLLWGKGENEEGDIWVDRAAAHESYRKMPTVWERSDEPTAVEGAGESMTFKQALAKHRSSKPRLAE